MLYSEVDCLAQNNPTFAKQRRLASFVACSLWPIALHDVDIAFKKHFVVASRLSVLLSLISSKSSVDNEDNF